MELKLSLKPREWFLLKGVNWGKKSNLNKMETFLEMYILICTLKLKNDRRNLFNPSNLRIINKRKIES